MMFKLVVLSFYFCHFELVIVNFNFSTGNHAAYRGTLGCNLHFAITGARTNVAYCKCIFFQIKAAAKFIERLGIDITLLNLDIS